MFTLPFISLNTLLYQALLFHSVVYSTDHEHKVHNIVLYPEKHSWCQTTPIQQVVAAPGYEPVSIENNVCVGACFSYSIPKSEPAEPGELIGPYCDSCQPAEIKCYHVNLLANAKNIDEPKILQKRVQIITNCSCQSCDKIRSEDCAINDTNTLELPKHLFVNQEHYGKPNEDVIHPDLFDAQNSQNKQHFENDIKLKNKLRKWFENYQNESGENNKATEVEELNNNANVIDNENDDHSNKDLELSKNFRIRNHHKNPTADHSQLENIDNIHPNEIVDDNINNKHHHPHHNHHHHHLGDEQHIGSHIDYLIRGPHGSMVAAPTEIKLHIDNESMKPSNDEIVVIEQEHHYRPPAATSDDSTTSN